MKVRELNIKEVIALKPCLKELASYHNQVSLYHKGVYPTQSLDETLEAFCREMQEGKAFLAAAEEEGQLMGFCKINLEQEKGVLDYLIVREAYRGKGYGKMLMDWAMERFREQKLHHVEVKVIAGNEAKGLYEQYGFRLNSYVLWYRENAETKSQGCNKEMTGGAYAAGRTADGVDEETPL